MIRRDLSQLPAYVPGASIPGALKLASNESSVPLLPAVAEVVAEAAAGVNRYPDMGAVALRSVFTNWLGKLWEIPLSIQNIAVGNGSSALCLQSIQATCDAGDEVIFAWRSFEAYPILTRIAGAFPVQVPLTEDLRHDFPAMLTAITPRTRLVLVCNPNNPTGTTVTAAELDEFLSQVPSDVHVVLDEAYVEYNDANSQPNPPHLLNRYPNVAILRTMSKAYGLAGLRLGYLIGQADFVEAVNKVGIPFGVNSLAQTAGLASLEPEAQKQLRIRTEETMEQRRRVLDYLANRGDIQTVSSQANFVWIPAGDKSTAINHALKQRGIITRCFPGEGVRVTCTTKEETDCLLKALNPALDSVLQSTQDETSGPRPVPKSTKI